MSLLRDVGRRRRRIRSALTKATATTALLTASAVLMGMIQAVPAVADTEPEQDDLTQYRNSIGSDRRLARCKGAQALHIGGPLMKAKAIEGLAGTEAQLSSVLGDDLDWWLESPLDLAADADEEAGGVYANAVRDRDEALSLANQVYAKNDTGDDRLDWWAPKFGDAVWNFTIGTQRELAKHLGDDTLSEASPEALARAKVIAEENNGKDEWHDWASRSMLSDSQVGWSSRTSTDLAAYLKRGGFPTVAPAKDSPEYRVEVEDLKQAWAACDYANPYDPSRRLNEPVMTAMVEWELEYAGQADQRATIMRAEAEASAATREATDDLVEALGQAWLAEQLLRWRKNWQDTLANMPDYPGRPTQADYDRATTDLARYRADVAALVTSAKAQAAKATAAAQKAATAQQAARVHAVPDMSVSSASSRSRFSRAFSSQTAAP
ncbi:hypothetical protein ACHGLA_20405 [Streptomyces sp. YH02]|uniref:hypothetical protein n=1 Tax=Streptomyces sp. YH02 TaxID=3256999 RepID=UPI0037573BC9